MRRIAPSALLVLAACAAAPLWQPIQRPWTPPVVDVQRRVRVVLDDGSAHEVESPRLEVPAGAEPGAATALLWRGAGPDARFPARRIPIERVTSIEAVAPGGATLAGPRVAQATLVVAGVVIWGLILWAILV